MKKRLSAIISLFLIFTLILPAEASTIPTTDSVADERVSIGSSSSYIGMDYLDADTYLKQLGFKNIDYIEKNDLKYSQTNIENQITAIKINGKTKFKEKDLFDLNSEIELTYRSVKKIELPISEATLKRQYCEVLKDTLKESGFTNVVAKTYYDFDDSKSNNDFLTRFLVDGQEMTVKYKDLIAVDAPIVIETHFPRKVFRYQITLTNNSDDEKLGLIVDRKNQPLKDNLSSIELTEGEHTITIYDSKNKDVSCNEIITIESNIAQEYTVTVSDDTVKTKRASQKAISRCEEGSACVDIFAAELEYMSYEKVTKALEKMGFTNIELSPKYDVTDSTIPSNKLNRITVNNIKIAYGDVKKASDKVVVSYHCRVEENPDRVVLKFGETDCIGTSFDKVQKLLNDAGFTNIETSESLVLGKENAGVTEITINNRHFEKNDVSYKSNKVYIAYNREYTFEKLKETQYVSRSANAYSEPIKTSATAGTLKKDEKVSVTGKCVETELYRVEYDGNTVYMLPADLTTTAPEKKEEKTVVVSTPKAKTVSDYTFKNMDATKYAKASMNVRSLPCTDGDALGKLSQNDSVHVTGQCNETGWYRFEYNGGIAYGHNGYLLDEKVVVAPAKNNDSTVTSPTAPVASGVTYIVNTSSKKFHKVNCGSAPKPTSPNRWESTCSRQELIDKNYEPCKKCNP